MRTRIAASVVLAASLALTMSGCTFFAVNSTIQSIDAGAGVGAVLGQLKVRNAILLTKNGQQASFLVNLVNTGTKPLSVRVQYNSKTPTGATSKVDTTVHLDAGEVTSFGSADTDKLIFNGIDSKAGTLFPVWVQYGTNTGTHLLVPVLDGTLPAYSKLLPTPTPSPAIPVGPTVIPIPTPTPSATN